LSSKKTKTKTEIQSLKKIYKMMKVMLCVK